MSFDPRTAKEIDSLLQRYTADPYDSTGSVPRLVVSVANSKEVLYSGSTGYEQLPPHPATPEQLAEAPKVSEKSIFELFSCTKLVATIAALQLLEQGVISSLEEDASKWVPELKDVQVLEGWETDGSTPRLVKSEGVVTVRDLITHTSGSVYPFKDDNGIKIAAHLGFGEVGPNHHKATREHLTTIPMAYTPGKRWHYGYSNDWLALLVVKAAGMSLEEYFQLNIFKPLGINDISFHPHKDKMSMAYSMGQPQYSFGPGATVKGAELGGSGLQGSPESYFKIVRCILNGGELGGARLLKKETVDSMFVSHLSKDPEIKKVQVQDIIDFAEAADPFTFKRGGQVADSVDWGLGGLLTNTNGKGAPSHRGVNSLTWSGMANTYWVVDKENDLAFMVWTNILPHRIPAFLAAWLEIEPLFYKGAGKSV